MTQKYDQQKNQQNQSEQTSGSHDDKTQGQSASKKSSSLDVESDTDV